METYNESNKCSVRVLKTKHIFWILLPLIGIFGAKIEKQKKDSESARQIADIQSERKALAGRLKKAWDADKKIKLYADHDTQVSFGAYEVGTGRELKSNVIVVRKNQKIFQQMEKLLVMPSGYLRAVAPNGDFATVSPFGIYLKK